MCAEIAACTIFEKKIQVLTITLTNTPVMNLKKID